MITIEEADAWIGCTAVDDTGEQVGMISQIWVDDDSGQPAWASVMSPILGREALVPLGGAIALGGGRQFAYTKEEILDAPHVAKDGSLGNEEKEQLCLYYGPPEADVAPAPRSSSWIDRIEDMIDRSPGSDRGATPAPADGDPAPKTSRFQRKPGSSEKKEKGRFGRKSTSPDQKPGRRFGRKSASPAPVPADHLMEPDEVPASR